MSERGLQAELATLIAQDDASSAGGEQLGLDIFDDFVSPVAEQLKYRGVARTGRPGRPEGAKGRQGMNLVRLLKATRRPTLLALKEWAELPLSDFMRATGIGDPVDAFVAWFKVAELVTAYEEGRPTQRVELDATGVVALPVVLFGDPPVRPDLVDGNPPDDGSMINVTAWKNPDKSEGPPGGDVEGAHTKAHEDEEGSDWKEQSDG